MSSASLSWLDVLFGGDPGDQWVTLDPTSAPVAVNQAVCLAGTASSTVTKALAAALTAAGTVAGVVKIGGQPGALIKIATSGVLPGVIAPGAALYAKVDTTTANVIAASSLSSGDYPVGTFDASGNLTITRLMTGVIGGGGGGVSLAGDLLGTGSVTATPRVGSLTGISGVLAMATTAAALIWNAATTTPQIGQQNASGTPGALMTIAAQTSTGAVSTGGGLALSSGAGTSVAGNLELQTGGTAQLRVTPSALISVNANPIQFGTTNPAASGLIRAAKGVSVVAARNSINTGDYNLVGTSSADIVNVGDIASNGNSFATSSAGVQSFLFAASGVALSIAASFTSFQNGGTEGVRITPNGAGATTIQVAAGATSFTLNQASTATTSAIGAAWSSASQDVTGTGTSAGGARSERAGNATGAGTVNTGGAYNISAGTASGATANVPGQITLSTAGAVRGSLWGAAAAAHTFTGTVNTTNGSASITFSIAQTLAAGSVIYFGNQPGVPYYLAAAVAASTAGTLTTTFGGTTNATNTIVTGPSGIGVLNLASSCGISYGSSKVPLTGFVRLAGGGTAGASITTRNNADTADMNAISFTSGDAMNIGDSTNGVQINCAVSTGGAFNWNCGASTPLTVSLASFQTAAPFAGSSFLGTPMRYTLGTQAMPTTATTQTTPSAAVLSNPRLTTTAALTANQDCILPTTSSTGGFYFIDNQCTGAFSVTFKASGQTGVTVANGKKCVICLNSAGTDWVRWTPDT